MLGQVDLSLRLDEPEYSQRLRDLQVRFSHLARELYKQQRTLLVVFEGWDAGGKGGAIRRMTESLDPRSFHVLTYAAPTDEENAHHYLWRFWRKLPPPSDKQILIFDRSWYGRVLVERVEGFARVDEWQRAYREINDFERQLIDAKASIVKFWFHISKEEQLKRFELRKQRAHKRWKLTDEDWRNRERWDEYEEAVQDMLVKTSTSQAPWTIVEGDNKRWARVRSLETVVETLEAWNGAVKE